MQDEIININIVGDLVINKNSYKPSYNKDIENLFANSDLNIANLECPVTNADEKDKIYKTGPFLKGDFKGISHFLKLMNVNMVTLANNHILDYGEKGINDTLKFCSNNEIIAIGAGKFLKDASKSYITEVKGKKIAFVNFSENEWASATPTSSGANPMDIIDNRYQIVQAKQDADYVIVVIHGGHEHYALPSPRMQKQYRFYAESGADLIVGHHSHCLSGFENHNGVPIFYSLGNFLFTVENKHESWYKGAILSIKIIDDKLKATLLPTTQTKEQYHLELLNGLPKENVLKEIEELNEVIKNPKLLQAEWDKFVKLKTTLFMNYWSPISNFKNPYVKALIHKIGVKPLTISGALLRLNLIRCEAHYDLSKQVLKNCIKK